MVFFWRSDTNEGHSHFIVHQGQGRCILGKEKRQRLGKIVFHIVKASYMIARFTLIQIRGNVAQIG